MARQHTKQNKLFRLRYIHVHADTTRVRCYPRKLYRRVAQQQQQQPRCKFVANCGGAKWQSERGRARDITREIRKRLLDGLQNSASRRPHLCAVQNAPQIVSLPASNILQEGGSAEGIGFWKEVILGCDKQDKDDAHGWTCPKWLYILVGHG